MAERFTAAAIGLALMAAFCCATAGAATFGLDYRVSAGAAEGDRLAGTLAIPALRKGARTLAASSSGEHSDEGILRFAAIPTSEAPGAPVGLAVGDSLEVAIFEGCTVKLTLLEQTPSLNGGVSFLATADGYDGMLVAAVVCMDGRIHIDIQDFLSGRVYSVLSSSEQTVVMEVDSRRLPCGCGVPHEAPRRAAPRGTPPVLRTEKASYAAKSTNVAAPSFVDILVVYDTLAAEWAKKRGGGVNAFAEVQVQKMNAVLANTELDQNFRFRLVGTYEVGGSAGGNIDGALDAAQSGNIVLNGVCWDGVHAKRDEMGADIVCVLVDNGLSYGTTGIGFSLYQDSWEFSEYAYNACLIRAVATGLTMVHEVGHNMGAGHPTAMSDVDSRGPQYHSYSAGYYFPGDDGEGYHTVMAYSTDGYGNYYLPAPFFSSPNYTFKSVPVGDRNHDNSSTLRQTFVETSLYRTAKSYEVVFGKNGGVGGDDYVTATYGAAMPTPLTAPTFAGYTFAGYWDTLAMDANGNPKGKQYYGASMKSVRAWDKTSAATLWAKWTNRVTFGKNGGTGGDSYVTCTKGQPMPKRSYPTKDGWVFDGYWDTVKDGGKQYYDAEMKSVRNWDKNGEVTLWAKWHKAASSARVAFGKNGGTGGDDYVTATEGQPMPTPRTAPKRAGWTFGGYWDTLACDANGNPLGKQYYDKDMNSVRKWDKTSAVTLWAKWTVRVQLGKNGGTGGDDYVTVTFNQPFPKRAMPTKSGYAFGGYWVSASSRTGQCYNVDGTGTSSMKWTAGGSPTIWALWIH